MPCFPFDGLVPVVPPTSFVHPSAVLIGDVIIAPRCYIAPCAVLRGDMGRITIGEGANVQDNCVLHSFPGADMTVEEDGHIGHSAVLHGCRIERNALVGMSSVIMDGAVVGRDSFVGAMSFVKSNFVIPPSTLVLGSPARVVRLLTDAELAWKIEGTREYHRLAEWSAGMGECQPLSEAEPNRRRFAGDILPLSDHRSSQERGPVTARGER